ncbi:putative inorganic phosphate cotransporter [Amphibalanus amphitrite]|uniref:Putative inorganic phosphate cotransporter n=1 Tax=Amphibalanus amphitrite TaxID=1232801 RepID=A0A6A4VPJ3_AMPAM|nr:putative inorganic phosphate cotransporter [Amphibalanus amphitrite]
MENGEVPAEADGLMGKKGKYSPTVASGADAAPTKRHVAQRYVFAVLGCIGMSITYGLKVNFHVCIVTMINHTAVRAAGNASGHASSAHSAASECAEPGHNDTEMAGSNLVDGPFTWDAIIQGVLLGSYFYGYLVTQVLGGRLAELLSAKWTFGVSVFLNVLLALLTPPAAWLGWGYLLAIRILQGMVGGVTLPATHVLLSKWSPVNERSRISSLVYAGMSLGTVISVSFTGLLAAVLGWEEVFYVQGGLSLIFVVLWFVFVYDSPEKHPWISDTETALINQDRGDSHGPNPPLPWREIIKSLPFWAIMISHTGSNFGWYMILTELPTYMSTILGFDIASNAVLSSVPFLVMWIYSIILGNVLDHLGSKGIITRTTSTKIATSIAAFVPALCLAVVTYVGCQTALAVFLLTIATGAIGSMYSGFLSNHISIAPAFAGTLMAITNTAATVPGMLVPSFVGALIHEENTVSQWRIIFFVTSGLFVFHGVQYLLFASGEEQQWAKDARRRAVPQEEPDSSRH